MSSAFIILLHCKIEVCVATGSLYSVIIIVLHHIFNSVEQVDFVICMTYSNYGKLLQEEDESDTCLHMQ